MLQLSWSELRLSTRFSPLVARGYLSGACLPTRIHCIAYNLPNRQSIKVALRGEEPAPQRLGEKKRSLPVRKESSIFSRVDVGKPGQCV